MEYGDYATGLEDQPQVLNQCVLGVVGLQGIMNGVDGIEDYNQRSLPLAGPQDMVVIAGDVDLEYVTYLSAQSLGPNPENVVTLSNGVKRPLAARLLEEDDIASTVRDHIARVTQATGKAPVWHPFFYSDDEFEAATKVGARYFGSNSETVRRFYDKISFKEICKDAGLHVAEGQSVYRVENDTVRGHTKKSRRKFKKAILEELAKHGELFVRGNLGASGCSSKPCDYANVGQVLEWMQEDYEMSGYLIEKRYDIGEGDSPSLMVRVVDEGKVIPLSPLSGQILSEDNEGNPLHEGNYYPASVAPHEEANIKDMTLQIAQRMSELGYRGDAGIDWMRDKSGLWLPAECNARNTGASVPANLRAKLTKRHGSGYVVQMNVHTDATSFAQMQERAGNALYTQEKGFGFIPVNIGPLAKMGKFSIAVYGRTPEEINTTLSEAANALNFRPEEVSRLESVVKTWQ